MSLIAWIPSNFSSDKERCLHRLITLNNLTTSNLGTKLGKRYIFNGSSSSLIIPNVLLSADMTFALWVKFNTLKSCFLLDARATETGYLPIYFDTTYGVQIYGSNGSSQYIPTGTLSANTWYHFTVTIKNGVGTLYINGVKKDPLQTLLLNVPIFRTSPLEVDTLLLQRLLLMVV